MFEGRKAKKLGIKDLGVLKSKLLNIDAMEFVHNFWVHASCGGRLREGRKLDTGTLVKWCPKCKIIWD